MWQLLLFIRRSFWRTVRGVIVPIVLIGGFTAGALPMMTGIMGGLFVVGVLRFFYPHHFGETAATIMGGFLLIATGYAIRVGWDGGRQWLSEMWRHDFWRTRT
jgi:hypothetical protein